MRQLAAPCCALVATALACAALEPVSPQAATKARTTAVGLGLREYRIAIYRNRVPAGRVRLNIENLGEDGHDVRVSGPSGASALRGATAEISPGGRRQLIVTLRRPGLYRLVCTLGDHAERGMVSRLRVVPRL